MELTKNYRSLFLFTSLLVAIACAAGTGFLLFRYYKTYNALLQQAKQDALAQTLDASKELGEFTTILKPVATSLAQELSKKQFTPQELEELLRTKKTDAITSVGVIFLPHAFDKGTKLFSRVLMEKDGKVELSKLEETYDYTEPENLRFHTPLKKGEGFLAPYNNKELDTLVAEYAAPIYRTSVGGQREVVGVAFANQSTEHLRHILETLFMGQNGYWFIVDAKGLFLAYPQVKYQSKTIFDIATDQKNKGLAAAAQKIIKGESVTFEYNNEITGAPSWLISSPIKDTSWSVVGVFDQGEIDLNSNDTRRKLIVPSLSFLFCVLFLIMFTLLWRQQNTTVHWALAMVIMSVALLFQIGWVWYAVYHYPYEPQEANVYRVENRTKLYEYLKKNFVLSPEPADSPYKDLTPKERLLKMAPRKEYVPTGIYLVSLQFAEASEIKLSGYFWHRYTKGLHDGYPRGFVFGQTNDATIKEESTIYNRDGQDEIVTYDVFAKINQFLTYTLYPFDVKSLRIKYWTKTSNEDFYLIPDLHSYNLINPRSLPGIDPDVHIPGWTLTASYFGYQTIPYTTNFGSYSIGQFGLYRETDLSAEPQPFFEVVVRRDLYDALVSDLLPIAVIIVLLFLLLMSMSPTDDKYLTIVSSIFFATIFAHIRFRSKIPQSQIVYLESLYFILYAIMLILLMVRFLGHSEIKTRLTQDDYFFIKMAFWPLFFGSFAAITLLYLW